MDGNISSRTIASEARRTVRAAPGDVGRSRKHLLLALLASIIAHALLLAGFSLPEFESAEDHVSTPLVARIAPLAVSEAPAKPRPLPKPRARKRATAQLASENPIATTVSSVEPAPEPAGISADASTSGGETPQASSAPVALSAAAKPPPVESIPFPSRILLEFDVAKGPDQAPMGRVTHYFERDGTHYLIRSVTKATGLAALFVTGRYVQESRGTLSAVGLRPEHFSVRRGRVEKVESTDFDWSSARATVSADGHSHSWNLRPGAQDQLSVLHQMSLMIDALPVGMMVTNGRRFFDMNIEIVGRDWVTTGIGLVPAVHLRGQREGGLRLDVWLAPKYGNLPVKVRFQDRRGEEFEQVLAEMKVTE